MKLISDYSENKNSENVLNDFKDWWDTMKIEDFTRKLLKFTKHRSVLPRDIRDAAIILTPIVITEDEAKRKICKYVRINSFLFNELTVFML